MSTRTTHAAVAATLLFLLGLHAGSGRAVGAEAGTLAGGIRGRVIVEGAPAKARVEVRLLFRAPSAPPIEYPVRATWPLSLRGPDDTAVVAVPPLPEDGSFVVDDLAPGHYALVATAQDGRRTWDRVILPAGMWKDCTLRLASEGHEVGGRLAYADGRAFDGLACLARVDYEWTGRYVPELPPVQVDPDGRFRFQGVGAGAYAVVAVVPGRLRVSTPPFRVPGTEALTRVVDEATSTVRGTCRDASGAPVEGADVWVVGDAGDGFLAHGVTEASGRYALPAPDAATLHVLAAGRTPVVGPAKGGDVVVARSPVIRGRVADGSGDPVADMPVHLILEGETPAYDWLSTWSTRTDARGHYRFHEIPEGEYLLVAFGEGRLSRGAWSPYGGTPIKIVAGGDDVTADLEVSKAAALRGVARDVDGRPIRGALVSVGLALADWEHARRTLGETVTDAEGRFELDSLRPETTYRILVSPPGLPPLDGDVRSPKAGEHAEIPCELPGARRVRVRVEDFDTGQPVPGALLQASQGGRGWYDLGRVGDEGEALLGPLYVGEWFFHAFAWGWAVAPSERPGVPDRRIVNALTGELETVVVAMVRSRSIRGLVLRADGEPAVGAEVVAVDPYTNGATVWPPVVTDAEGRFELVGLRTQDYRVEARARPPEAGALPWKPDVSTKVEADQEEIRLRLP